MSMGHSGDIMGRYVRKIITPSIDVIIKIADSLEVSIDFLVGKTNFELDNITLKRVEEISALPYDKKIISFALFICQTGISKRRVLIRENKSRKNDK
jgi:transcriptional regulator with XRE-family HTH domain